MADLEARPYLVAAEGPRPGRADLFLCRGDACPEGAGVLRRDPSRRDQGADRGPPRCLLERIEDRRLGKRSTEDEPVRVKELRRVCLDALAAPGVTADEARGAAPRPERPVRRGPALQLPGRLCEGMPHSGARGRDPDEVRGGHLREQRHGSSPRPAPGAGAAGAGDRRRGRPQGGGQAAARGGRADRRSWSGKCRRCSTPSARAADALARRSERGQSDPDARPRAAASSCG